MASLPSSFRPLHSDDAEALLDSWNRSLEFDSVGRDLMHEKVWGDPDFHPGTTLVTRDLSGLAMGVDRPAGKGYVKFLWVTPERRRQGLGRQVLQALEERLRSPEIRVCESHPNYLLPGVDVRYTPALLMLEKMGYEKIGETYNLTCDLAGQDFVGLERDGIRRATAADFSVVMAFLERHFVGWKAEVTTMFGNDPISLHLAYDGDQLAGFSGYDGNNLGTGWFGPMGTDPDRRSQGLGGILLKRCLADLKAQGLTRAIIPWVGPYGFYSHHCGARIDRVFWRYEKRRSVG